jgi:hypothetical protein
MNQIIINRAINKLNKLRFRYSGFINVGIDNWRGYRFIFDCKSVRTCTNACINCPLFKLLKSEKLGLFSAGLLEATADDIKLFGPQKYLNCKTLKQYQKCYTTFIVNRTKSRIEIANELELIKGFSLIYSKYGNVIQKQNIFQNNIVQSALNQTKGSKQRIIKVEAKKLKLI